MVAVLLVFANHLSGWPRGGFVGVDVFFVISGFLITGNLLRMAEADGNVSFKRFYWNRIRRIVPAATVVLLLTVAISAVVFQPFRVHQVGMDAFFASIFISNWWFAARGTDYFAAGDAVSPIQHYWSLSIEEQFYFVWPAVIFVIGIYVGRKEFVRNRLIQIASAVMGGIVTLSLAWALYKTTTSPTWAYFDTLARAWELGVGALLATAVSLLARIPADVKPWLSWAGLSVIAASAAILTEGSHGFPAPWALLPVAGSALVIAAGVNGEPRHQPLLRGKTAVYIGNISYSLYLVHWPVIVILSALWVTREATFLVTAIALTFALSIASYHFVETPLRRGGRPKPVEKFIGLARREVQLQQSTKAALLSTVSLIVIGLVATALRPPPLIHIQAETDTKQVDLTQPLTTSKSGPLEAALQKEIRDALAATEWPQLEPSLESVITGPAWTPEVTPCGWPQIPDPQACTWGSPQAAIRIVLVGDSVALGYAGPLRELALNSGGKIQLRVEAAGGCEFIDELIWTQDDKNIRACPNRKQHAIDVINSTKPDVVIVSNFYGNPKTLDNKVLNATERAASMTTIIDKFRANTKKIVWLSPPPQDKKLSECYGSRSSRPVDCVSKVTTSWSSNAEAEQGLAQAFGGAWIDSSPWFCRDGSCPAFVGSTPTKADAVHMTPAYGRRITPVIAEALKASGVL